MPIWGGDKSLGMQGGGLGVPHSTASPDVAFLPFLVWLNQVVGSSKDTGAKVERASFLPGRFLCPKGRMSFLSELTLGLLSPGLGSMVGVDGRVGTGQASSGCCLRTLCGGRAQHLQTIFLVCLPVSQAFSCILPPFCTLRRSLTL